LTAAPVNSAGLVADGEMEATGPWPVGMIVEVALGAGYGALWSPMTKLAQPMRVLLAKWSTNDRLPKYAGVPGMVLE
jgi:hypothetical protein